MILNATGHLLTILSYFPISRDKRKLCWTLIRLIDVLCTGCMNLLLVKVWCANLPHRHQREQELIIQKEILIVK